MEYSYIEKLLVTVREDFSCVSHFIQDIYYALYHLVILDLTLELRILRS